MTLENNDFGLADQLVADHMMKLIQQALDEVHTLYPTRASFTAGASLLTAGVLLIMELSGREKAVKAVRAVAQSIAEGSFDQGVQRYRLLLQ